MLYSLTDEQVKKMRNASFMPEFSDAEMLFVTFESDPDVIRKVLPSPLRPSKDNTASAFIAKYPKTNFGSVYNEGALFLNCEYKGERGAYCLSMPVDDDMALIGGREGYGYPKKIADRITLECGDDEVVGSVVRKGTEIIRIECRLSGDAPDNYFGDQGYPTRDWNDTPCIKVVSFLFKYFPSPGGNGFDYMPRLIREPVLFRSAEQPKSGSGSFQLGSTKFDPLGEIPVKNVTRMAYGKFNNTMLPGKTVSRTWNILKFLKHAFFKNDMVHPVMEQYDPSKVERRKEIFKKAKKY